MLGFAVGGIMMGRLADRFGILVPLRGGTVALALGYFAAGQATSLWQYAIAHGVLIGLLGSSATFGPIISDVSRSEEHTSELQSLMRIPYAVFCLKKKKHTYNRRTPLP